ncbi:MAG: family 10 glycosylhydrolase [Lentisphaeria bacterium]|nr:family 10 glycosylhydrolase [Lentisphaeria bacterium]
MIPRTRSIRRLGILVATTLATTFSGFAFAQQYREIKHPGAGYIGPGDTSEPAETSGCLRFAYPGSAGFPCRNRSLVVDLGDPAPTVHRIVLIDDYSDNGGDSPTVREHGLLIYTSNDNRAYAPYTGDFETRIRSAKPEGAFDAIELDGLNIRARYIKLHANLPDDKWDLGNHDLRRMVRVFQDPDRVVDILSLAVDRYAANTLPTRIRLRLPKAGVNGLALRILMGKRGEIPSTEVLQIPISQDGGRDRTIDTTLALASVPLGPKSVCAAVVNAKGHILARTVADTFVCSSVITRQTAHDGAPIPSRPGQAVILQDLGRFATKNDSNADNAWSRVTAVHPGHSSDINLLVSRGRAPTLRIPLPASGWHAVAIGLVGGDSRVMAKLLPGGAPRHCRLEIWGQKRPGTVLGQAWVGYQNLGNSVLEITPVKGAPARLAFIRLLGLSADEIDVAKAAGQPLGARRVIIHSDGFSGFYSGGYATKEKLLRVIDRFAESRIYSFDWCIGGSTFTYNTQIGTLFGSHVEKFWRQGDRLAAERLQKLIDAGEDPLRVIVDRAHERGIRINATLRMNANYGGEPAKAFNGKFYWENLDLRIVNKEGKPQYHLSYAYPAVREFRLAIIREAAGYGVDGIHMNFLRHPPFFGYDPPLVAAFRKQFGVEPDAVADDERWHRLRADIMTEFVRQIRKTLDEVGAQTGKRIALSATMEFQNYLEQGLDVERWVKEGLVDLISPGVHGLGGTYFSVKPFAEMTRGTQCKLFPMLECTIRGHDPTPASERGEIVYESERMTDNRFRRRFLELHREGAMGVYPFNGGTSRLVNTLSHVEGLYAWERFEKPLVEWFSEVQLP